MAEREHAGQHEFQWTRRLSVAELSDLTPEQWRDYLVWWWTIGSHQQCDTSESAEYPGVAV